MKDMTRLVNTGLPQTRENGVSSELEILNVRFLFHGKEWLK